MDNDLGTLSVGIALDTAGLAAGLSGARDLLGGFAAVAATALGGAAVAMTKMAGDFQMGTTQLVTSAGEQASALDTVRHGLLAMAPQVGTSIDQLTKGMYMAESAGFHLATGGLLVLQNAAMGAKAENADLGVVMNAVTSAMNAYHLGADQSATVTNTLVGATAAGKMHMQDLAGALSNVLPASSKFGISLVDTTAAIATMTMQGDDASSAATHLRQVLIALEAPAKAGASALTSIGLTTAEVAAEMRVSLPGAIQMIVDHLAKEFPAGSEAYNQALKNIAGGSKQLLGLLELSGTSLKAFKDNVVAITGDVRAGGDSIMGWDLIQGNFNFKMDQAKAAVEALGIKIGTALLPLAGQLFDRVTPLVQRFSDWAEKGNNLQGVLSAVGGVIQSDVVDPAVRLYNAVAPIITDFEKWNEKTHFLQNTLQDVGGFINTVAGYVANNLVPPIRSLIGNLEQWLSKSNLVHDALQTLGGAIGSVTGVLGTLVGWVSGLVGWLAQGSPAAKIFEGVLWGIGAAIATIKMEEFVLGLGKAVTAIGGLSNLLPTIVTRLLPNFAEAIGLVAVEAPAAATQLSLFTTAELGAGTAAAGVSTGLLGMLGPLALVAAGVVIFDTTVEPAMGKVGAAMGDVGTRVKTMHDQFMTQINDMKDKSPAAMDEMRSRMVANLDRLGTMTHEEAVKMANDWVAQAQGMVDKTGQAMDKLNALVKLKLGDQASAYAAWEANSTQTWAQYWQGIIDQSNAQQSLWAQSVERGLSKTEQAMIRGLSNISQDVINAQSQWAQSVDRGLNQITQAVIDAQSQWAQSVDRGIGNMQSAASSAISSSGGTAPGHALGGSNLPAGISYVAGERGPELITPSGSTNVYTASQTAAMRNGGGQSSGPTIIVLEIDGRQFAAATVEHIAPAIVNRMRLRVGMRQ